MKKVGKNLTYLPTKAEERLLAAKLDPENRLKTVVELCRIAKISRETFYTAFRKEGFRKLYREVVASIFERDAAEVAHSVVREAKRGSAQHAKMSLEISGVYQPKNPGIERIADTFERWLDEITAEYGNHP